GGLAIVDDARLARGRIDEHEPAAADVARGRMRDGEGERGGNSRIDRVAALLQDREPRLGARLGHSDDHAIAELDSLFAGVGSCRDEEDDRERQGAEEAAFEIHGVFSCMPRSRVELVSRTNRCVSERSLSSKPVESKMASKKLPTRTFSQKNAAIAAPP